MGVGQRLRAFMDKHIDYRAAVAGAMLLSSIVFLVNFEHGWSSALTAASKQGVYTFFAGGYMARLNERIALALNPAWLAVTAGVLGAGGLAVSLTFLVHSLRGTPEPLNSTLPTVLLCLVFFTFLGIQARRHSPNSAG